MPPSLPQASIRTLHKNSPAKTAKHAQSFCRYVYCGLFAALQDANQRSAGARFYRAIAIGNQHKNRAVVTDKL